MVVSYAAELGKPSSRLPQNLALTQVQIEEASKQLVFYAQSTIMVI